MVRFIIGDYNPTKNDEIIDNYNFGSVLQTKLGSKKRAVIFGEFAGLTKNDCKAIAKKANRDCIIVLQSNKLIKNIRQSKNVKIEYENKEITSIFEIAKAVLTIQDRDYIFEFLKTNKPQMFMLVKAFIGAYDKLSLNNKNIAAYLDTYQWKVNPDILYGIMAYKMKAQKIYGWLGWKFPKKEK
jgi:triacylglycerol esterase/lipase EstA (alpha/beta hydrolase family)